MAEIRTYNQATPELSLFILSLLMNPRPLPALPSTGGLLFYSKPTAVLQSDDPSVAAGPRQSQPAQ